ncbi:hypothetical protein BV20DRAFT_765513 [Pilatotrama ljubarskyi]|nr:hypothetical protein BV20DRAFT_765513 [Pilatotrama ljubarskyi]
MTMLAQTRRVLDAGIRVTLLVPGHIDHSKARCEPELSRLESCARLRFLHKAGSQRLVSIMEPCRPALHTRLASPAAHQATMEMTSAFILSAAGLRAKRREAFRSHVVGLPYLRHWHVRTEHGRSSAHAQPDLNHCASCGIRWYVDRRMTQVRYRHCRTPTLLRSLWYAAPESSGMVYELVNILSPSRSACSHRAAGHKRRIRKTRSSKLPQRTKALSKPPSNRLRDD